jgi:hypothetical protein
MADIQRRWIKELIDSIKEPQKSSTTLRISKMLSRHLSKTNSENPLRARAFVAGRANLEEFKVIVQEFAVDGLTETQAFFYIMPRLTAKAQMPVMRVIIDEFGCGNLLQIHSELYRQLLSELEMSTEVEHYLTEINEESYDFLNVFYWLTKRAPDVDTFLGLAYLESIIPFAFKCYVLACNRLRISNSRYFTEHIHIDQYHAKDALQALREVEATKGWIGGRPGLAFGLPARSPARRLRRPWQRQGGGFMLEK